MHGICHHNALLKIETDTAARVDQCALQLRLVLMESAFEHGNGATSWPLDHAKNTLRLGGQRELAGGQIHDPAADPGDCLGLLQLQPALFKVLCAQGQVLSKGFQFPEPRLVGLHDRPGQQQG